MLYWAYFSIFLSYVLSVTNNKTIVLVWGVLEEPHSPYKTVNDWNTCVMQCLQDDKCVVIHKVSDNICLLFHLGNITFVRKANSSSGQIVGFKRTMNSCPVNIDAPLFGQQSVPENVTQNSFTYKYEISRIETNGSVTWKFEFNNSAQCQEDSFPLIRGQNQVCISVRLFESPNFCQNHNYAMEICKSSGATGLSGSFTFDEGKQIAALADSKSKTEPAGSYSQINFWIDGNRTAVNEFSLNDDTLNGTTGYKWAEAPAAVPLSSSCVFLGTQREFIGLVYIHQCTITSSPGLFCQRGAICRTEPLFFH
ncbi:hypothetical protein GCK72_001571 [Caenorhabditis remanei]|uniref:PAN-3 domain-containing protein n=1 Tax=Caenorhabditis remanei TaxID=31234 RepID=A0A6A5HT15_CAERE|nr:hypothetical protein GCK72_001571 [Caenorhabditis remanei]KAF1769754.1 hypothetical protein GCK72_001571 [Caenorhabditis remanei]